MFDLRGGTWSIGLFSSLELIIWHEALESVLAHVALLLKDSDAVVQLLVHFIEVG